MASESALLSLLSIVSLTSFFTFLLIQKFSQNFFGGALLDTDFTKPQAFHDVPISRCGGLAAIISLLFFYLFYSLMFEKTLTEYISLSITFFVLGFLDDIKFKINPNYRLVLMFIALIIFISFFSVNLVGIDLIFLSDWLKNQIFLKIFLLLCFLFVINGANLIDGFNGLLAIHILIINLIILFINLNNNNTVIATNITGQIIVLFAFLLYNFPKAKIFFGDSGSYLFGSLTAYNIIETNNLNPEVSSFFYCILLFYLFFEVFFSFFRKLYFKRSPFKPDRYHLHMLSYGFFHKSKMFKDCNYLNSIIINTIFLALILPAIFFRENGLICKYWFFSLLLTYILFYFSLYSFEKKQ